MTREHILGEIIRLTEANGGTPIGVRNFLSETGIKAYDWGRFWATWGDAVREAGFSPNKFTSSLEENDILEYLASLTRKLRHFPTRGEMRLEKIKNPAFPDVRTIGRRRKKGENISALLEYCKGRKDFTDVTELLALISPRPKHKQADVGELDDEGSDSGYVYLIRSRDAYKIGCTQAPYRRASEIANQSAYGAELIHLIPTDDPFGIEKYWHDRFEAKKVAAANKASGEWFELSAPDIRAFKRRKSFM